MKKFKYNSYIMMTIVRIYYSGHSSNYSRWIFSECCLMNLCFLIFGLTFEKFKQDYFFDDSISLLTVMSENTGSLRPRPKTSSIDVFSFFLLFLSAFDRSSSLII